MSDLTKQLPASTREKLLWTSLLVLTSAFGFLYVDLRNAASAGNGRALLPLETRLDSYIPFVPEFIVFYVLYYPWVLLPLFVLRTREAFYRALGAFALTQLLAQTVFVFLPSHMIRPQVEAQSLAASFVRLMYRVDMGWNLFPSLHVAHSVVVALLIGRYATHSVAISVWAGTLLICASTLLVKQHYLVDVPAGMLLGWFCYVLAHQPLPFAGRMVWHKRNQAQ